MFHVRYEQSDWGWNDKTKKEEMAEEKARYIIARKADGSPVAAVHFRFDLDCDDIVLYWLVIVLYGLIIVFLCSSSSYLATVNYIRFDYGFFGVWN